MLLLHLAMQHIGLPHHQVTRELFLKELGGEMHRTGYLLIFFILIPVLCIVCTVCCGSVCFSSAIHCRIGIASCQEGSEVKLN